MIGNEPARLLAGVLFCAALLASCAHQLPPLRELAAGLPPRAELAGTPFFPQERYQCGPAALATVLNFQGIAVTPEELVARVYIPEREGSLQAEIVAAARRHGMLAIEIDTSLHALLEETAAGHPVLVLQNLGLTWLPRWHYAVVVGYDLEREELVLRSGTERRRITPMSVFLNTWDRSGRWGIVVLPPGAFPERIEASAYLEAVSALEATGGLEAAHAGYRAATRKWPANTVALLGLGNTEYALGRYPAAEEAFRDAIEAKPATPAAWNNLAYALAARQCGQAAMAAAHCAVALAPGNGEFGRTLREMEGSPRPGAEVCRALPACPAGDAKGTPRPRQAS